MGSRRLLIGGAIIASAALALLASSLWRSSSRRAPPCHPRKQDCSGPCDTRGFAILHDLAGEARDAASSKTPTTKAPAALKVEIAFALYTAWPDGPPTAAAVKAWTTTVQRHTDKVFAQCNVEVRTFRTQLIASPAVALSVQATERGSQVGTGPKGVDSAAFHRSLAARLAPEARTILRRSRRGLADHVITVSVVDQVFVYRKDQRLRLGALAFPAVAYRHADDVPLRNGVLVGSAYRRCGAVPQLPAARVVAHELGHMLLDQAFHEEDPKNLMSRVSGPTLSAAQCARIRDNVKRFFTAAAER